jgi:hypothetical protein
LAPYRAQKTSFGLVKASAWQEMNIGFRHTSKIDGRNPAPPKGWLNPYK